MQNITKPPKSPTFNRVVSPHNSKLYRTAMCVLCTYNRTMQMRQCRKYGDTFHYGLLILIIWCRAFDIWSSVWLSVYVWSQEILALMSNIIVVNWGHPNNFYWYTAQSTSLQALTRSDMAKSLSAINLNLAHKSRVSAVGRRREFVDHDIQMKLRWYGALYFYCRRELGVRQ